MPHQFEIVENLNQRTRTHYPYLLVLQHDRLTSLRSTIAAPLVEWTAALANVRIHPTLTLGERHYIVLIEELAAVPPSVFGPGVGSAEAQRYDIIAALDLLFTGI